MRIAVITSSYPRYPGDGTAPFVKSICEHLAKLGHAVEVVAPYDPAVVPSGEREVHVHRFRYIWPARLHIMGHARALESDVRLRPLAFALLPFFLAAAFLALMRVTGRQKSQAIHAHWVIPNGVIAAAVSRVRGIPFIISLHGSDIYLAQRNALFGAFARWAFRRAAGVTACSRELRDGAVRLGAPGDPMLLAWGANPQVFHPGHRSQLTGGESPGEVKVLGLGRFVYKKGFDKLISAMAGVVEYYPQARLILGGDGSLKQELIDLAEQAGLNKHVTFPGSIPWNEVPRFLADGDIFVLPSIRDRGGNVDGLPTVLLEAMSSGLAVIASEIGGVNLVIEHERNGILVPPGDVAALEKAILDLARDENRRKALGSAARQSVVERFNWENVARRISELLEEATGQ